MTTLETKKPDMAKTPEYDDPKLQALHDNRHEKKGARRAFHALNFLGLHVLFNSTVSLFIAYNLLPTKPARKMKEILGRIATPMNSFFHEIATPVRKIFDPKYVEPAAHELEAKLAHSARSRVETAFMCIAGFLALWPVKYLEDHRAGFLNKVDNWLHPGRKKEEKEAAALKPGDEPKETWSNLIRARIVGLGVVFSVDALQQRLNNWMTYETGNIDTAVWKWGAKFSEKMPSGIRSWLVGFFSRHNINLGGIQHEMRPHLLRVIDSPQELHTVSDQITVLQKQIEKTRDSKIIEGLEKQIEDINVNFVNTHPHLKPQIERAVFAEQSRLLLTKELFLTVLISTVIYTAAKAPFMARFFEKIHLKKKEPEKQTPEKTPQATEADTVTASAEESKAKKTWSSREEKKSARDKPAPAASFTEAAVNSQSKEAMVSL
jgi:hypothetical protein